MLRRGMSFLMYHELQVAGVPLCQTEAGYVRYVVRAVDFRRQLDRIRELGLAGVSVGGALASGLEARRTVVITFDDGCASDFTVAAPALRDAGFGATFYVTVDFLGRRGYMTRNDVRALAELGFEIGSHGLSHAYLTQLAPEALGRELALSRSILTQITGRVVEHLACPGGRWSPAVAAAAATLGYRSVATSRPGENHPRSDLFSLARLPVLRETSDRDVERRCVGRGRVLRAARGLALAAAKSVLSARYERWRDRALGRPTG